MTQALGLSSTRLVRLQGSGSFIRSIHAMLDAVAADTVCVDATGTLENVIVDDARIAQRDGMKSARWPAIWHAASLRGVFERTEAGISQHLVLSGTPEGLGYEARVVHVVDADVQQLWVRMEYFSPGVSEPQRASESRAESESPWPTQDNAAAQPLAATRIEPRPVAPPPQKPDVEATSAQVPGAWASAAALSAAASTAPSEVKPVSASKSQPVSDPPRLPGRGDYVHHMRFGICRVDLVRDRDIIVVRTHEGIRKTLKLSIFELGEPTPYRDKTLFKLNRKAT